jgi:hypothetical protein
VSKEAWIAVVCVLGAFILGGAALGAGGGAPVDGPPDRAVFAGGPEATESGVERRTRARRPRARVRATGGPLVSIRRGRSVHLHRRPGAPPLYVLRDRTPFGSRAVLPVVRRRGAWLAVLTSALPAGRVGWIRDDPRRLAHGRSPVRVIVDRSERRLTVVRHGREIVSANVGVGSSGSETPTGHMAVTDKLPGARYTSTYGCCILALSGRQTRLPAGWRGGDRLAIHGTDGRSAASVSSAGCVTVDAAALWRVMGIVPLGTVVTIRP